MDSVFKRDIYLIAGPSGESEQVLKKRFGYTEGLGDYADAYTIEHDGVFIIWLEEFNDTPESIAILSHEVSHTTFAALTYLGINHCDETDEVFAYYNGSLMEQAIKFLRK